MLTSEDAQLMALRQTVRQGRDRAINVTAMLENVYQNLPHEPDIQSDLGDAILTLKHLTDFILKE